MILACTLALALRLAAPAEADEPSVADLVALANAAADAGDYARAEALLEEVVRREPDPIYIVAWAQASRLAGDCVQALELYERFRNSDPPREALAKIEPGIAECEAIVAKQRATLVAALPPSVLGPVGTVTIVRPPERDPAGIVLVGAGAAFVAAGIGLSIAAEVDDRRADREVQHGAFEDRLQRARLEANLAYGAFGVGAALVIASAIRFALVARKQRARRITLGMGALSVRL